MDSAYSRFRENRPGSQPTEIRPTWPFSRQAASTASKCWGIFAWVSKLSMTWKYFAISGVCLGRSVALPPQRIRSEEHTSELQSRFDLVCRLLLEKKKTIVPWRMARKRSSQDNSCRHVRVLHDSY